MGFVNRISIKGGTAMAIFRTLFGRGEDNHNHQLEEVRRQKTREQLMHLPIKQITQRELDKLPKLTGTAFATSGAGTWFKEENPLVPDVTTIVEVTRKGDSKGLKRYRIQIVAK
jgi:hypothetical protein